MMKYTIRQVIDMLPDYDHAFISEKGALKMAEPFGIIPRTFEMKDTRNDIKGLRLYAGESARGVCAADFAMQLCQGVRAPYESKFGRGSQLHECVRALREHFKVTTSRSEDIAALNDILDGKY